MSRFASIEALERSDELAGMRVVDPGIPLTDFFDGRNYGPLWKSQPELRKVVGFIARHVASLPLNLYRKTDTGRVKVRGSDRKGAELSRLLRSPTREVGTTRYRLWESLLVDGLLHDFFVGVVQTDPETGALVVRRIPARKVRIKGNSLGVVQEVAVEDGGRFVPLDPASLILDIGYSERGVGGTAPAVTLSELLETNAEAVQYRKQMMRNGARLGHVIERPREAKWSPQARTRFATDWDTFAKANVGGTAILDDGMVLKKVEAFRPKDTEDLAARRLTAEEVASMYYVPPELLGIREGNFSNVAAFMKQLYGPTLGPYIEAWEQVLNVTLVERWFGLDPEEFYIEANVEAKLRGSFEEQATIFARATGGPYMTRAEARDKQNLPFIEGSDELIVPLNVTAGGQASSADGGADTGTQQEAIEEQEVSA